MQKRNALFAKLAAIAIAVSLAVALAFAWSHRSTVSPVIGALVGALAAAVPGFYTLNKDKTAGQSPLIGVIVVAALAFALSVFFFNIVAR